MVSPCLSIDCDKIEHNARIIVNLCKQSDIKVAGVTKCVCGHPEVARSMLRGGVASIADSRLENIDRLKQAGIDAAYMLLRIPPLSAVDAVVEAVDVSLNSELAVLQGLSAAACRIGRIHNVIIMVDLGDLREGIWPDDLIPFVRETLKFPGLRISGLGTNLGCFGGVVPSENNMKRLVALANVIEQTFNLRLDLVSGVNSSGLELIAVGLLPMRINHARIGEAILLGRETVRRHPWPDTYQDAFVLHAEVLELKKKPSVPVGERGQVAFGVLTEFEDRGVILRALLNVGREDVDIDGIAPLDSRLTILGGSSGYLVVDVTRAADDIRVGNKLAFSLNYGALLAAMTSGYVKKRVLNSAKVLQENCRSRHLT